MPARIAPTPARQERSRRIALAIVWVMIALYVANFAALSLLQDAAFETGAADLGNMNQAAWYTLHRGFPADTYAGRVLSRFGGHVEPVFYLLAIPYALHQAASSLLVLQTIIIALGALAAYWLARDVLQSESAGLAFALAYLLSPALEAANLTEFHPVALASTFLLLAFYYVQKGGFLPFAVFALLAMSTKEDMSLLVVMLGLYALVRGVSPHPNPLPKGDGDQPRPLPVGEGWGEGRRSCWLAVGLIMCLTGLLWFILTVYVIIPHSSASADFILFQRYAEVGGNPQGLLLKLLREPGTVVATLLAPQKIRYLAGLLLSMSFLSLGAPGFLLLAAPTFAINMLSNYPPMYSGLSHYSAPVVPFVFVAAVYGARTVQRWTQRHLRLTGRRALLVVCTWLLVPAALYHIKEGFTPLSSQYRVPQVTAHHRLLARFVQQIPPDARLSAQPPLHPHFSSREFAYPFPVVNDADYVLLDVTARPTMHPNDLKSMFDQLVYSGGFGVVDAADGYILLQRGAGQTDLPESFFWAFRTAMPRPQYQTVVSFGKNLTLLGFDIYDVDEGRQPWTTARFYWQVTGDLPSDLRLYPFYTDDQGRVIEDTTQRPLVATIWYPPSLWRPGETLHVQTLPWPLGERFRLNIGVVRGEDWGKRDNRLAPRLMEAAIPVRPVDGATVVELGVFERQMTGLRLRRPAPQKAAVQMDANLGGQIRLAGYSLERPGEEKPAGAITLTLYWQALTRPDHDYHTFAHIYDDAGRLVAQDDGPTGNDYPPSWWIPGQTVTETRTITLPPDASLSPGTDVFVGLYRLDTGVRLPVLAPDGKAQSDGVSIPLPKK